MKGDNTDNTDFNQMVTVSASLPTGYNKLNPVFTKPCDHIWKFTANVLIGSF